MEFSINHLRSEYKTLVFLTTLSLIIGYGVALVKAVTESRLSPQHVVTEYRGGAATESLDLPKEFDEVLQNTHAHALAVPLVYFLLSWLFCGTTVSSRLKKAGALCLFAGFFAEYAALWGLRYVHPGFVWLIFAVHAATGPVYLGMAARVAWESA